MEERSRIVMLQIWLVRIVWEEGVVYLIMSVLELAVSFLKEA